MRAVFLTFSGPLGRLRNVYEMWSFSGAEVLEGVLRGWFANDLRQLGVVQLGEGHRRQDRVVVR
jgi:hypothetical protein